MRNEKTVKDYDFYSDYCSTFMKNYDKQINVYTKRGRRSGNTNHATHKHYNNGARHSHHDRVGLHISARDAHAKKRNRGGHGPAKNILSKRKGRIARTSTIFKY